MRNFLALVLVAVALAVTGCSTPALGGGAYGNPSQGSTQPAANVAQNVGKDQAAVPSTANGGQGFINNHFASESDATVRLKVLEMAETSKWTPEQVAEALKASSSAPQNVTITGSTSASGGNAAAIGSGTGGGSGVGGSGTATSSKP